VREGGVHASRQRLDICRIHVQEQGFATERAHRGDHTLTIDLIDVSDRHVCTEARHAHRNPLAQPIGAGGHECNLVVEPDIGGRHDVGLGLLMKTQRRDRSYLVLVDHDKYDTPSVQ
jgi:hypothetical protein